MDKIYLIRRNLPSMGDAVGLGPLISIAHETIPKFNGDVQLWLQCDDRIADFYQSHPHLDRILKLTEQPPENVEMILNIETWAECPSIQSLVNNGRVNASQLFCDVAQIDGEKVSYDGRAPMLYFSEEEKAKIDFLRRGIATRKVCIQIKAGHKWKNYPHLKHLIGMLARMEDVTVFVTHDAEIPFETPNGVIPLIALPYRELMIWLGAMDLFIGLDSGPTHVAAAIGTRTYAIFGPTDPTEILGMFGKHVSWNEMPVKRCRSRRCWLRPCKHVLCLQILHPKVIMKDVKRILSEGYINERLSIEEGVEVLGEWGNGEKTPTSSLPTQGESIAVMRLDGLGGTMTLADQAKKLHEKTGRKVVLVTRGYETLFEGNPHIDRVINVGMRDWQECSLVMRNQFESLAEIRFGLGKWHSDNGYFKQDFKKFNELFANFPLDFNRLEKYGLHHVQLTDKTLGLPYDTIDTELFVDEEFDIGGDPFILVNNGVDIIHGSMRQTKCWDGWNELVPLLDMKVVQVGTLNDRVVKGAFDIRGQTNLKQLIYLIKKADKIVVTEGGIMHLAQAAGNPNVIVIGGPTQGPLFEYPDHKWVTSHVCGNCWSITHDWYEKCPKGVDAVCMRTISPERVAEAVLT